MMFSNKMHPSAQRKKIMFECCLVGQQKWRRKEFPTQ